MATEIWSYLIVMSYTQLQNEMLPTFTYQVTTIRFLIKLFWNNFYK